MEITKIVVTGGPCAGKGEALRRIRDAFAPQGYTVLVIQETTTDLINGGVAPWTCGTSPDFQGCQIELQLDKEKVFERAARTMSASKVLLVLDRSALDGRAYVTEEEFAQQAGYLGTSEGALRNRYDAVFHLETAAKGVESAYTLANNTARIENPAEAVAQDNKTLNAWVGHPHFRLIPSYPYFPAKMDQLVREVSTFLGLPGHTACRRSFLVRDPDREWLERSFFCRRADLTETFLPTEGNNVHLVYSRTCSGDTLYFERTAKQLSPYRWETICTRLTEDQYRALQAKADPNRKPLSKSTYCMVHEDSYFEVDLYPFWQDRGILRFPMLQEESPLPDFPVQLRIIGEVSENPAYKDEALAAGVYPVGLD